MQEIISYIALSMGVAWASGVNLYAAILVLGLLGTSGNMVLPEDLQILQNPLVIGAAGIMFCIEFFADKIPGVDSVWDTLHTFIRIPAGAVLAASVVAEVEPSLTLSAALVGGSLTAATHLTKASTRLLVNTSPEPFSNIGVSLTEDALVIGGLWTALHYPLVFLIFLVIFLLLMIWLLPILWRGIKGMFDTLRRLFRTEKTARITSKSL
ncbi:MAG: DUF4126 domain-containing protein [Deltaproteobacteria bacterium]|nr:DUF4126 domain-containing protein [Deltaproteobacteria bacterium]